MRVLIVAGASGGHIFPAVGLCETLVKTDKDVSILLVLPHKNAAGVIPANIRCAYVSCDSWGFKFNRKNALRFLSFLKGLWESLFIFARFNPNTVVGFGSITSIAFVMLGWLARRKVVLHEQNVYPGKANRFLAGFCDTLAISFTQSEHYFSNKNTHIVLTGNPIRKSLVNIPVQQAREYCGLEGYKITILIAGGSQSSHSLNLGIKKVLPILAARKNIQFVHLCGIQDKEMLKNEYALADIKVKLEPFWDQMQYAYSAADIVISRAGATTIAELMYYKAAAILVPYPYAYQHQLFNAKVLEEAGCAQIITDQQLGQDVFLLSLIALIDDPGLREQMRKNYEKFPVVDASKLLAQQVLTN